jgi:16S rRNA (uracil1498-N3)-methyltransferase
VDQQRRRAAAHAFVDPDQLDAPSLTVGDADRHHLDRVLRLRPGQPVVASDGAGRWRACQWAPGGRLDPTGPVLTEPAPEPAVVVGFAVLQGDRSDWVVQKLTELGVDRLLPFVAERSVVRWDAGSERALRQADRWRRVAREAAMQSRQVRLPAVEEVRALPELVADLGAAPGPSPALAEAGGARPGLDRPLVLIGPEGGWSSAELALGLPGVDLGPSVLRAETAAIAAGVLLCGLRSRLIQHEGAGSA